jgi:DNA-binding LacI/PurR family transcriptional regulator
MQTFAAHVCSQGFKELCFGQRLTPSFVIVSEKTRVSTSIKDIARAAGVAPSTVSRALRDRPGVSAQTGARIRHLAEEMDYTPSLLARSLVTRDTATIGLVITYASDPFLARLVAGVEEAARENGYSVFLSSSYRDADREQEVIRSFHERRASGIIVTGSQIDAGYRRLRERFPLPIVLTNCRTYPYSVSTDNRSGAEQAVDHLARLGHQRIAYVSNQRSFRTNDDRFAGYQAALARYRIPLHPELVIDGDGTLEGGAQVGQELLALSDPATAIFCFNDLVALGVLHALERTGFTVPRDCSIVGFDDLELAAYACPPLTTVRQASQRIGELAMRMLIDLIQGQDDVQAEVLPAELVIRETTGPAPAGKGVGRC